MNGLLDGVKREYRLAATELKPFHSVWKVLTPKGIFLLKQMHCTPEHIAWLHGQIHHLSKAGFEHLLPFLPTHSKSSWFAFEGRYFVVTPWQSGTHPSFTRLNPLQKAAAIWGRMHQFAKELHSKAPDHDLHPLQDLRAKTNFLASTLNRLRAQKTSNRIDRAIAQWGDYYLTQAQICLADLEKLRYDHWASQTMDYGFCHNDPAPRNIIIQERKWILIDYELSRNGLFLQELALFIRRALAANQWDPCLIAPLLESYTQQRAVTDEELAFLPGILYYPHAFWRLCHQRFAEELDWSEKHFQSRLWQIAQDETHRSKLLRYWFGDQIDPCNKLNGGFQ